MSFDFPSSPDFKPRKSEGDCQQFSSDWQVPLRQEEAFMVTGLHVFVDHLE